MTLSSPSTILIVHSDPQTRSQIESILRSGGYRVSAQTPESVHPAVTQAVPDLALVGEAPDEDHGLELAAKLVKTYPLLPVILVVAQEHPGQARRALRALRAGLGDVLALPLSPETLLGAVERQIDRARERHTRMEEICKGESAVVDRQAAGLDDLVRLGRSVVSSLDVDTVLTSVVEAAVRLAGAEEGSLLLLDEHTGELYVRAARNFNDEFVKTFRLPIQDTLAGSVLRDGKPALIDGGTPQKIKTSYLVHSLLYVPLQLHDRVFGVLGVDNRRQRITFNERHVRLLETLAGYAVIALENARLYAQACTERARLETILTATEDGVILIDEDQRLVMVNPAAVSAFGLQSEGWKGHRFAQVFTQQDLLDLVEAGAAGPSNRAETQLPDGRVFLALLTPIPGTGQVITLRDITYLKNLSQIKSDFVSTVSHDLRSPLTAVLGYVELIERAGSVTDLQREFIRRVQGSVHNITALIDDLVNLGRIESGFDSRKEPVQIAPLLVLSAEGFQNRLDAKAIHFTVDLPAHLPPIYANAVQMRHVFDQLIDNAIRYTPDGGAIEILAGVKESQVIVHIRDNGMGIPAADLPFIFDKFYRAANASAETSGTGLGLAIVKSVIDQHQGRVWIDSVPGKGSTVTLVISIYETLSASLGAS